MEIEWFLSNKHGDNYVMDMYLECKGNNADLSRQRWLKGIDSRNQRIHQPFDGQIMFTGVCAPEL